MPPNRCISNRQMKMLVEFAEKNRSIVLNHIVGPTERKAANQAWIDLARKLNSHSQPDGVSRTPEKWKRYWHLLKCRTNAKASDKQRCKNGSKIKLTDYEERIAQVLGKKLIGNSEEEDDDPEILEEETQLVELASSSASQRSTRGSRHSSINEQVEGYDHDYIIPDQECQSAYQNGVNVDGADQKGTYKGKTSISEPTIPTPVHRKRKRATKHTATLQNREEGPPRWAVELEERRIAAEERLADSVDRMSIYLQQISDTHERMLEILQSHFSPQ